MDTVLSSIPLVGWGPILAIAATAVAFLITAVLLWSSHNAWRWVFVALFVVTGLAAAADWVNTRYAYYDTLADLFGVPTVPSGDGIASAPTAQAVQPQPTSPTSSGTSPTVEPQPTTPASTPTVQPQPNGLLTKINIPDTNSHFGQFDANVWLPPQYFTDSRAHFPVILLIHGNPGSNNDWLNGSFAVDTGLAAAQAGKPVILVFPTVLQNGFTGDSLCLDTPSNGKRRDLPPQGRHPHHRQQVPHQRRPSTARHRWPLDGWLLRAQPRAQASRRLPDLARLLRGDLPVADTLPGGLKQLFGANHQQQADANDPSKYWSQLDGSKGPALFLYSGTGDTAILSAMQKLAPQLKSKGFTVELQSGPGAHEFPTFGNGFKAALPWAAARFYP